MPPLRLTNTSLSGQKRLEENVQQLTLDPRNVLKADERPILMYIGDAAGLF